MELCHLDGNEGLLGEGVEGKLKEGKGKGAKPGPRGLEENGINYVLSIISLGTRSEHPLMPSFPSYVYVCIKWNISGTIETSGSSHYGLSPEQMSFVLYSLGLVTNSVPLAYTSKQPTELRRRPALRVQRHCSTASLYCDETGTKELTPVQSVICLLVS